MGNGYAGYKALPRSVHLAVLEGISVLRPTDPPGRDGRPNRWSALLICSTAYFLVCFHKVTPAVMVDELMAEFGGSPAIIGILSSVYFYSYMVMQIPIGFMADRMNPMRMVGYGTILAGLGSVLFGFSRDFTNAMLARALTGIGVSGVLVPSCKVLGLAFGDRFMMANGALMAIGSLGSIVAASPLAMLIEAFGWRSAFFLAAGLSAAAGLVCFVPMPGRENGRECEPREAADVPSLLRLVPSALLPAFISFFKYGPFVAYQGLWGVPFLMGVHGVGKVEAGEVMVLLSVSTVIACMGVGVLTGRLKLKPRTIDIAAASLFTSSWIPMLLPASAGALALLYASACVMGGADIMILLMTNDYIRQRVDPGARGTVMGIVSTMTFAGGAIFQTVMGLFVDGTARGYRNAFILCLVSALTSLVLVMVYTKDRKAADVLPV